VQQNLLPYSEAQAIVAGFLWRAYKCNFYLYGAAQFLQFIYSALCNQATTDCFFRKLNPYLHAY
jgi:hypothetical protein